MNSVTLTNELDSMAAQPGIRACAIVAADTGMIWLASTGARTTEPLWEAAVDYWRLHERQRRHFSVLGDLHAAVMYHTAGVLAVIPCCSDPAVLLVANAEHRGVDWRHWQGRVRALGPLIRATTS